MTSRVDHAIGAPLSPSQRDFLLDTAALPRATHHVLGSSIELGTDIDLERWQRAAEEVFESEPGMQLRLVTLNGETRQEVDPGARLTTEVVRLESADATVDGWVLDRIAQRPDIETDPSFVHALVRDQRGMWHAALMAPHIFLDGHGFRRFFERTSARFLGESEPSVASVQTLFDAVARAGHGADAPDAVAFWRRRLQGVSPLSFRTQTEPNGTFVDQAHLLSADESAAVEEFCRRRRIHPSDFFLAVYGILLDRFRDGEGPWVVHTIRSTRRPDERNLMGCFYRAVPTVLDASALELTTPLAAVLALPREDRDGSGAGLRISMLALQELLPRAGARAFFNFYNFNEVRALGTVRQMRGHFFHRHDEVHLVVIRRAEGFELRVKFHTSTFAECRLPQRLAAVAAQVVAGAATIGECDWLLADEKPGALVAPPAIDSRVEQAFARQALTSPDATAVTFGDRRLSYRELDAASTRVAHRLIREGVGPNTLVGVHVDRSLEQVAAILGILKAGGAYLPIDPEYPDERARFMVEDSGVGILMGRAPAGAETTGLRVIPFDDLGNDCAGESTDPPAPRATLDDLAYVIYTSGSTGRPKGTRLTGRNVASLLAASASIYDFGPADVWTLLHSCAFDFSVWEMFVPLTTGGRLVVVPSSVARSPSELAALIDREGVTVLNQTPSAFFHLAAAPELNGRSLRYVIFGGERLETRRLAGWFARFGDDRPRIVNMYGITETTVHVTHRRMRIADSERDTSPIGVPLPGWQVHLVDRDGRLVPRGCSGEIWVGGGGVGSGYLCRPELTATRFLDDPFHPGDGRRVYRSGDLARAGKDGALEYLGRIDDQVKIRGYRIELGEVGAVLSEYPGIREAVVVPRPGPEGAVLIGYAVPSGDAGFDEGDVLQYLRARLPVYMACGRVVAVSAFPLTAHGKLDRAALPLPVDRPPEVSAFVPPRTTTEQRVAMLFSEATGAETVGAEDDFFAIGGHSLAAMRIVAGLHEVFGVSAGVGLVFERPRVSQVAAYVDGQRDVAVADRPNFVPDSPRDTLPLTFAQERVYVLQRLHPLSTAYNFEALLRFSGHLDRPVLASALAGVVARHDAFRATFHAVDDRVFQRVHDQGVVTIEEIDFSARPREEADAQIEELRQQRISRTFDPAQLPLVEWCLIKLAADEHVLLHREHHLIHDGWSFVVFVRDLLEMYRAISEQRAPHLPPTVGVGDYAAAHRRWLEGPVRTQQREYWKTQLAGIPERVDLPTDRTRPAVFSFQGDQLRFDLPPDLLALLRATAAREGLTIYVLLLGAFSLVVSRLSASEDVAIAAGVAARRWKEIEDTVGMLLNNVVFRLTPRAGLVVREYLHAVRDQVLGALANQDLPFEEIVGAAGVQRSPSETPLGNVFFSSYEGTLPDCRLPNLTVDVKPGLATRSAKFDWNLVVIAQPARDGHDERVTVLWEFATDLFDRESVERARAQFLVAVRNLLENFERPLSAVSIVDESERRYLSAAAEGPNTPYPRDANIAELFAAQAERRPDAVAVRSGEHALTYAELDRRAAGVAAHIRSHGAVDEDAIAFLLPRGIDAVVTMLAILKAGCAYLPLSPKDPPARVAGLLSDADARLIITNEPGSQLGGVQVPVLRYDALSSEGSEPSLVVAGAERLAAIMFTSGSTGRPKGVEVTHRGIVRLLFGANFATFGPEERWLQLAPLSFDASTLEIWGALLHGGELVILPDELPSAAVLGEAIRTHGITMLWLNASLFNVIVDADAAVLAPLKRLLVGGEALSVPHIRRALSVLPDTILVNGYGPTENTTFSCCYEIPRVLDPRAWSIPIGGPIAHSRAMLLDAQLQQTPAGAIGEIFVGGDGLARGYRNRPDETSRAFVDHPSAAPPDRRLYRTGDLGRLRHDGTIEFRGRRDRQLKIRGHRIEPGEIEAALCRVPGVATASVQYDDDPVRGRSLVAFIVPSAGTAIESAGVLGALSNDLPAYMVPDRVLIREALPITAHGKIDAAALAGAAARPATVTASWPLPATVLESVIVDLFSEALGVPRLEPDDDFFSAGGHSLLVLRVLTKIERSLGVRLEPAAFFQASTPRLLSREIERRLTTDAAGAGSDAAVIRITAGARPLFFVPGGEGGDVSLAVYARLALHLPDHAFYGLRLASADHRSGRRHMNVQQMAASCIAELTRVHGDAPVDLVGGCVGGIVAYEMARQLEQAGHPPKRLILLDTIYPSTWQWVRSQARSWSARVRRKTISSLKASGIRRSRQEWIYRSISQLLPIPEFKAHPLAPAEWYRFSERIVGHKLKPLKMPVVLLATGDLMKSSSVRRWSGMLGSRLTVHTLPGTHWSYVRSEIAESGAILRATLDADT